MCSKPNYNFWRKFATLPLWKIAAMMKDLDPDVLHDVVDRNGDGPDLSAEIEMLKSAVQTQSIQRSDSEVYGRSDLEQVVAASAITWLRSHGYSQVAAGLGAGATGGAKKNIRWTSELIEEAREFRSRNSAAATAEKYNVSGTIIRRVLSRPKSPVLGSSVFNQCAPAKRK